MANPGTYKKESTDNGSVSASCQFTAGAAGAVGSVQSSREMKTTPVTHPGTGRYVFNFKEVWWHLQDAHASTLQASFATSGACDWYLIANNIRVDGTVEMNVRRKDTGALVDLASGDIVKAFFELQKTDPAR